jgi:hypothetical protein
MTEQALSAPPKPRIDDLIRIRTMKASDFNFIINSWLKTYKYSGPHVRRMLDSEYYPAYGPVVETLINRSDVYIACLREDPDVIVGYLAIENKQSHDIIHFALVKELWQKMGVGKYLLTAANPKGLTYFTHWTSPVLSLVNKYNFIFNPFKI